MDSWSVSIFRRPDPNLAAVLQGQDRVPAVLLIKVDMQQFHLVFSGTKRYSPFGALEIFPQPIRTEMKPSPASKPSLMLGYAMSLHLVVAVGCVSLSPVARHDMAVAEFKDPLAIRREVGSIESVRRASYADDAWRSVHESIQNLLHRERVVDWDDWARANLQDGDIVFLQSTSNWVWGFIELSQVTQDVTDSPFTHVALAAVEDGNVFLYDVDTPGPGRTSFGMMMASSQTAAVAVKRLHPEFQPYVPQAIQYCRDVYANRLPFDKQLNLTNDRLYCAELIEVAFRSGGLELSQPIRWDALPGLDKHPFAVSTIAWVNATQPSEFVIVPGNERIGIWASPGLHLILSLTEAKNPPVARGSRESQSPEREL